MTWENPLINSIVHRRQSHFNSNVINVTQIKTGGPPRMNLPNLNNRRGKEVEKKLGRNLDQSYYTKGPKGKQQRKGSFYRQKWLAIGPLIDPCSKRNSPLPRLNRFDPLSVEIEAAEEHITEQQIPSFACDSPSDADDEAEPMNMIIPRPPLLKQEIVRSSEADFLL